MIYALIGGKSKDSKLNIIEKYIFSLTKKEKPNILFSPIASKENDKSIKNFKELIKDIDCNLKTFTENDIKDFDELLKWADVLYVGGGNSNYLVDVFKNNNLDKILVKYLNSNKIYAGSSAGAMLYTYYSMGDRDMFSDNFHNYNYKMVECLNLINISICPHYQNEDLIIYNDEIKNYNVKSFGIEEDTCLIYDNDKFYVIKDKNNMSLYYFDNNKNYLMIPLRKGEIYE